MFHHTKIGTEYDYNCHIWGVKTDVVYGKHNTIGHCGRSTLKKHIDGFTG